MRRYRRNREGSIFFLTLVTHQRWEILTTELGRRALREAIRIVRKERPFQIQAIVLLPDHLHAVWKLPRNDNDYSTRWRLIKSRFTRRWIQLGGECGLMTSSRKRSGEQAVWQRRFYEHTCRDEADVTRCIEYIHINPVKHGLAQRAIVWPWSSFHRYVRAGKCPANWGGSPELHGHEFIGAE